MRRRELLAVFICRSCSLCMYLGGTSHPPIASENEGVVDWFISKLWGDGNVRANVSRLPGGGTPVLEHITERDRVCVYANNAQLEYMPRQRAEMLGTCSGGHKCHQAQVESVRTRIQNAVGGSRWYVRVDGGTLARMLELVSCFSDSPDHAPRSACALENL